MFESLTGAGRRVVARAREEALECRHDAVGTEHLLLAVLAAPDAPGVSALTGMGVTLESGRAALADLMGTGHLSAADADALGTLGIDLDEVRSRVEEAFGPGALDRLPVHDGRRRLPWRRGQCGSPYAPLCFRARAKRALERSLREAVRLGDSYVGVEHVLLGLLDPKGNMAMELLRYLDADPEVVRTRVLRTLGKAA